jgi:hypothetical protein
MKHEMPKPCPACGQEPTIERKKNAAQVLCHCGLRGPAEDATGWEWWRGAVDAWNELPAHDLASGEESAWLAVVVALRDKFHQQKMIDGGKLEDANKTINSLAEELRFWKERYRSAGETESWFVTRYEIWKLGGSKPEGL